MRRVYFPGSSVGGGRFSVGGGGNCKSGGGRSNAGGGGSPGGANSVGPEDGDTGRCL